VFFNVVFFEYQPFLAVIGDIKDSKALANRSDSTKAEKSA
jgi:hypothetical protein